ncbi:hypothetical protein BT96DRAFT_921230 [Gymnopus androsaceus JB14]|uniref:Uncharacterized protein n=1 Tax=Gymnopus androsaceus JB14 TaxID=1447944 RepID=A0A6A4HJS3_9AGAR|nr:hypothetical protein BT96DRAFT_921230 [Gymnopus androsaceus JB14]
MEVVVRTLLPSFVSFLLLIFLQPQLYVFAALFEHIQDVPPTDYDLGGKFFIQCQVLFL